MRNRWTCLILVFGAPLLVSATSPSRGALEVRFENLRNHKGQLRVCLTRAADHFPDCSADAAAFKRTVPASTEAVEFANLAAGTYAIALIHDENGNGRLDKTLGIPREGFGFSRNSPIRMGAPKFTEAEFDVRAGETEQVVRVRYIL